MADVLPGLWFGVKYRCIQLYFIFECSKLISLRSNLAENPIKMAVQYFGFSGNIVFELLILSNGWVLGGEASGHLLCLNRTSTGDGIVSALLVLEVMVSRLSLREQEDQLLPKC